MRNLSIGAAAVLLAATACAPRAPVADLSPPVGAPPVAAPRPEAPRPETPRPAAPRADLGSAELEELVVTSSRIGSGATSGPGTARPAAGRRALAAAPAAPAEPAEGAGRPPVIEHLLHELGEAAADHQAGQLTAADHDDLLNAAGYDAYARRFLERYGRQGFPRVDVRDRLRVTVRDADGRPAPLTRVEVRMADGRRMTLQTGADGRVVLFPQLDGLGDRVELTVRDAAGAEVSRTVAPRRRDVTLTLPSAAAPVRALDIVLVMDTTGSMGDELDYLTAELSDILTGVGRRRPGLEIRTGLVFYRDLGDDYTVRAYPFTGDPSAVRRTLAHQQAQGGGDLPEAMHAALAQANGFPWREDAVKVMLLVADAPPHGADIPAAWAAGLAARDRSVHIVPVAASGVEDDAQYLMRAMAAASRGRYVFITDDSGIGNPHAEPTVDCYVVTRLDQLLSRVIAGLVSGRRVEPSRGAILREVGDYDRGVCHPPS